MGNLQGLAGGDLSGFGPTGQDQQLIEQAIGAAGDMARRERESLGAQSQAALTEELAARGQDDSSIEGLRRMLANLGVERDLANMIDQQRVAGSQALMNLPFQRANVALGANQALFQQLAGSATPALQSLLQGRLANITSTTEQPFITGGQLAQIGTNLVPKPGGGS